MTTPVCGHGRAGAGGGHFEAGRVFCGERQEHPEIGEGLFISPRTVTTHVGNMINKINAANRVKAATYAAREGLA